MTEPSLWTNLASYSSDTLEFFTVSALFFVGLLGTLLPVIPGLPLIWLGILVDKVWAWDNSVSWAFVIITGLITLVAQVADYYLSYWGVKRFGGTWRGGLGAMMGLFAGFFIPPQIFWIIVAPVAGAVIGELLGGSTVRAAGKAGVGTIVGGIVAFVLKIALGSAMIAVFVYLRFQEAS